MSSDMFDRRQARYDARAEQIDVAKWNAEVDPAAEFAIGDPREETAAMIEAARLRNAARGIVMPDPVAEAEALLRGGL